MSKLENPYKHYKLEGGACLDCDACRWEAGARAVIARLRADAFLLRRAKLQEPIQKLADEYDSELATATEAAEAARSQLAVAVEALETILRYGEDLDERRARDALEKIEKMKI